MEEFNEIRKNILVVADVYVACADIIRLCVVGRGSG